MGGRGWDGYMASLTQWTWVWATSRWWWRTGKPGLLQSMGSQRVRHDWLTEQKYWEKLEPSWYIQYTIWSFSKTYILFICAGSQIKHFTHINSFNPLITNLWIRHYFYSHFLNCGNQEVLLKTYINTHDECYSSFCNLSTESKFLSITLYFLMMHRITKGDVLELCKL